MPHVKATKADINKQVNETYEMLMTNIGIVKSQVDVVTMMLALELVRDILTYGTDAPETQLTIEKFRKHLIAVVAYAEQDALDIMHFAITRGIEP